MSRKARNRPGRTKTVLGVVGFVIALFSYLMLQQDTEVEPVAGLRQNYDGYSNYSLPLHFAYKKYNTTKVLCGAECTSTDSCNAFTYKMNASVSCRLYRQPPTVWGYQASEDPTADVFFKKYLFGRAKRTLNGRYYYIGQKLMTVKEAANHCETLPGGIFQLSVNSEETERLGLYKIMYTVQKLTIKDGHQLCLRECHWLDDCRAVTYKEAFNSSCRHYRHTPAHWEYSAHTDRNAVVYLKKSLFHANATMKGRKFYQLSSIAMNLTEAVAFCDQLSTERMSHVAATYERPPKPSFKGMLEERYQLASEASRLREKSSKSSHGIFYQTITNLSKLESQDNGPVRLRSSSYVRTYHIYDGHHKVALLNSSAKGFAFCEYNPLIVDEVSVLAFTGYPAFDVDIDLREIVYSWN
ncbi:uncharacterized protein LOC108674914 [Hyalella azteca]|uniref:Uncharacterized protein LOC108674914 n=1 Tax=Hyalella azteca TaxID=294128 RepID=A0A8B7NXB1_HYAAZ|nr:uncharacterized protein LOC108674914 [Hyalella azteca]